MQNFTPAYMKGLMYVRTTSVYVRMILSEPKFLGCIDNQTFLAMVLSCMHFACKGVPLKPKNRLHNSSQSNKINIAFKTDTGSSVCALRQQFFFSHASYVNITDTEVTVSRHKKQIAW